MWSEYFKKHAKRKPRELLVRAVSFCENKENALDLLSGLKILEFVEEEKNGETASGSKKHWHVFHFIVEKI